MMYSNQVDPFHAPGGLTHFKATILWAILPEMIIFSGLAFVLCIASEYGHPLELANSLITVGGTVLGFVVSYRTSSAYERYTEGRKLWAAVVLASRTFSRMTWIHVPNYTIAPKNPEDPIPEEDKVKALIEKKSTLNLVVAFSVALKHYLRGEAGILYKDLFPLVSHIPKYNLPTSNFISRPDLSPAYRSADPDTLLSHSTTTPSHSVLDMDMGSPASSHGHSHSHKKAESVAMERLISSSSTEVGSATASEFGYGSPKRRQYTSATYSTLKSNSPYPPNITEGVQEGTKRIVPPGPLLPSSNPPPLTLGDWFPFYALFSDIYHFLWKKTRKVTDKVRGRRRRRKVITKSGDNIPLEITLLLSGYIATLQRRKIIDVPTTNALLAALQSMVDSLTGLERILHTPIPVAYSLHLRHCVWLYLLFLPSQIRATLGWATVPATAILTFVFCGLLAIGQEIESPFGYDNNDLHLDAFTRTTLIEVNEITAHDPYETENIIFVESNLPFATPPTYEGKSAPQLLEEGVTEEEIWEKLRHSAGHCDSELRTEESIREKS